MSLESTLAESTALVNEGYAKLRADCAPEARGVLEALHEHHLAMLNGFADLPRLATEALAAALEVETKPLAEVTSLTEDRGPAPDNASPINLGPGERIINGRRLYSAAWLEAR